MAKGHMKGKARAPVVVAAHKRRVEVALSGIGGFCRGLDEIDVAKATAALSKEERRTWARHARAYGRHLAQFARLLTQELHDAEAP